MCQCTSDIDNRAFELGTVKQLTINSLVCADERLRDLSAVARNALMCLPIDVTYIGSAKPLCLLFDGNRIDFILKPIKMMPCPNLTDYGLLKIEIHNAHKT